MAIVENGASETSQIRFFDGSAQGNGVNYTTPNVWLKFEISN
jgi:hypothetical protein